MDKFTVVSFCDGISIGRLALEQLGYNVDYYRVKMVHRFLSSGFTTLIFKDEQHYKDCVAEYKRISGGTRKVTAKDLDGYDGNVFNGVRYMNQVELERCQGVPDGFTSCLTRNEAAGCLGDSWTLPVIKWCFSFMETKQSNLRLNKVC